MMNAEELIPLHVTAYDARIYDRDCVQVIKTEKLLDFDTDSYAKLKNCDFHNGTIEVKVLSRLLPDAPDYARGFIGIAYRIKSDDGSFESFYVRPTNGKTDDPVRKSHGAQYFSYPVHTFAWFRERGITKYDGKIEEGLDEWIDLKAEIHDEKAVFYVNGRKTLEVNDMYLGKEQRGSVGLFVDIGTEGYFRDLKIEYED